MIQRIQSIYLLFAAILMSVFSFSEWGFLYNAQGIVIKYTSLGFGILNPLPVQKFSHVWMIILPLGAALVSLVAIFLYGNRKVQISYSKIAAILIAASLLNAAGRLFLYVKSSGLSVHISLINLLPFVAFILVLRAIKGIKKDENLVRSLDRIR